MCLVTSVSCGFPTTCLSTAPALRPQRAKRERAKSADGESGGCVREGARANFDLFFFFGSHLSEFMCCTTLHESVSHYSLRRNLHSHRGDKATIVRSRLAGRQTSTPQPHFRPGHPDLSVEDRVCVGFQNQDTPGRSWPVTLKPRPGMGNMFGDEGLCGCMKLGGGGGRPTCMID